MHPPCRVVIPQWNLNTELGSLCEFPFEPLSSADIKWLSLKTAFLLAITSAKHVSELHVLSVSRECLQWGPEDSKVLSSQFTNTLVVVLASHSDDPDVRQE